MHAVEAEKEVLLGALYQSTVVQYGIGAKRHWHGHYGVVGWAVTGYAG